MKHYKYIKETDTFEPIKQEDIERGDIIKMQYKYRREPPKWMIVAVTNAWDDNHGRCVTYRILEELDNEEEIDG